MPFAESIRRIAWTAEQLYEVSNELWSIIHNVETVQVVIDKKLLLAADRAARRSKQNRSAFVRDAIRQHLRSLEVRSLEQRDREGYTLVPQSAEDDVWDAEAAWPEE